MTWGGLGSASSSELENSSLSLATVTTEELLETAMSRGRGLCLVVSSQIILTYCFLSLEFGKPASINVSGGAGYWPNVDIMFLELTRQLTVRHLGDISHVLVRSGHFGIALASWCDCLGRG